MRIHKFIVLLWYICPYPAPKLLDTARLVLSVQPTKITLVYFLEGSFFWLSGVIAIGREILRTKEILQITYYQLLPFQFTLVLELFIFLFLHLFLFLFLFFNFRLLNIDSNRNWCSIRVSNFDKRMQILMCSFFKTKLTIIQLFTPSTSIPDIFDWSLMAICTLDIMKYIIIFLLRVLHLLFLYFFLQRRRDLFLFDFSYWFWL